MEESNRETFPCCLCPTTSASGPASAPIAYRVRLLLFFDANGREQKKKKKTEPRPLNARPCVRVCVFIACAYAAGLKRRKKMRGETVAKGFRLLPPPSSSLSLAAPARARARLEPRVSVLFSFSAWPTRASFICLVVHLFMAFSSLHMRASAPSAAGALAPTSRGARAADERGRSSGGVCTDLSTRTAEMASMRGLIGVQVHGTERRILMGCGWLPSRTACSCKGRPCMWVGRKGGERRGGHAAKSVARLLSFRGIFSDSLIIPTRIAVARTVACASRSIMTADRAALHLSQMRPLGKRLLVLPQEPEAASAGGVLLPGSAGAHSPMAPTVGSVLSVGTGVDPELRIAAGDLVLFSKYGTADVDVAEGEGVFVDEGAVLAKLNVQ